MGTGWSCRKRRIAAVILSGLIGILAFFLIFGLSSLSLNDNRLFSRGDPGAHYIGWRLFRDSDWQGKIGIMNRAGYPFGVSVIFTDSIPLMAVICKVFRTILPREFNYLGLWTLFSFFMQGVMACLILMLYIRDGGDWSGKRFFSEIPCILGAAFFVITPAFIKRAFWHTALTSHFLILISLYLLLGRDKVFKEKSIFKMAGLWALTGILCGSIHLYFLGICGLIAFTAALDELFRREGGIKSCLLPAAFSTAGSLTVFELGGFDSAMISGAPGFGFYSFNLNGFFNGDSWSSVLKFPLYDPSQAEGFAYLGLGMILIVITAFILAALKLFGTGERDEGSVFPAALVLWILSTMTAVSNVVTFSDRLLFSIDLNGAGFVKDLSEIFRSSGRFAWVSMYLLMIGGFAMIILFIEGRETGKREMRYALSGVFIAVMLVIQICDLFPGLLQKGRDVRGAVKAENVLRNDYWQELSERGRYRHLFFLDKKDLTEEELYSLTFYAIDNGMSVNDFNFSRAFMINTEAVAADSARHAENDCIYILTRFRQADAAKYPELEFRIADGLMVGVKK